MRPYANLREVMTDAVTKYADDVRNGTYPSEAESYALPAETAEAGYRNPIERLKGREVLISTSNYGDHQPPSAHEFRRAQNTS